MMQETLKLSQIENFAHFLGLNAIISKLVVGNIPVVSKMKRAYQTYMKTKKSLLKSVQYWLHNGQKFHNKISLNLCLRHSLMSCFTYFAIRF